MPLNHTVKRGQNGKTNAVYIFANKKKIVLMMNSSKKTMNPRRKKDERSNGE